MANFPWLSALTNAAQSKKKEKGLKPEKPNIILIVIDDQVAGRLDIMPTIKSQLLDRGITFSNSFCTSPLCAPARASILTGQYLHNHQETRNSARNFVNKRDKENTIATVLKAGGYKTVFIGKYTHGYNNASYIPSGWDEWHALLGGAPGYYNYEMSDNGKLVSFGNKPGDYCTDVLAQKACDVITKHKNTRQPFFMCLTPVAPHWPRTPASRHLNKFRNLKLPQPLHERDINDKPQWVRDRNRIDPITSAKKKHMVLSTAKGLESLLAVDEMIEAMIKMLTDMGKMENTFLFFLADNGEDISKHISGRGKTLPYEEGICTPIIVRGPGIVTAQKCEYLVSTVDLLPTIAELARIPIPDFVDGRSLVPLLSSDPLPFSRWRNVCIVELGRLKQWSHGVPPPGYKLLRARNFKYIEYDTGEKEFYDLKSDPDEFLNIYRDLNPEQKKMLQLRLHQLGICSKNKCREIEDADISIFTVKKETNGS